MRARFFASTFIALSLLLSPLASSAQAIPGIADPLTLILSPEYPRPEENVRVSVQSFSVDLDSSLVSWSIDNKAFESGVGMKEITVRSGKAGSVKKISVRVTKPGFAGASADIYIRPASVSLVWKSDTYVPPFYRGKALHSYNGSFRVTAIPEFVRDNGTMIPATDLIYTWKKNGEVVGRDSGYGKNTFVSSQTSYLKDGEAISVEVSAPQDSIVAFGSVTLYPVLPKVVLYENNPLYGKVAGTALSNRFYLQNDEVTLVAEPFYFSAASLSDAALSYTWKIDGVEVPSFSGRPSVTLQRQDDERGRSNISVIVQNKRKVLQGGKSDILITFDGKDQ